MKILHIIDHYKPHFSGYVFRTSYILKYQKEFGLEPVIITSPKQGDVKSELEEIDNIKVYRTSQNNFGDVPFVKELGLMKALQSRIEEIVSIEKPDVIHAHSPSLNGLPALRVGRKYGIPVVYEVRAFWEDAAVDHGTFQECSFKYKISKFVETNLFKKMDALFTICEGLKDEIISRGLSEDKITVIPNCVDTDFFSPCDYDEEIANSYGLKGKMVFGFIGSFYNYEGIDLLIDAYQKMLQRKDNMKLILVGDGPEKDALFDKAVEIGLHNHVIFTGKVPHKEVKRYYSVIDVLVYPRKRMRLTELVTPLKPLEAMAMGKVVVGSDVGGIKELITPDKDGLMFRAGDADELLRLLSELTFNREKLSTISKNAIETVQRSHRWDLAVKQYIPIYERLVNSVKTVYPVKNKKGVITSSTG